MKELPADFEIDRYGLHCRLVQVEDAEFIVSIRSDEKLSKYINHTDISIPHQVEWIKEYKKRESEGRDYYFIFERNGDKVGVYRLYNIVGEQFDCGSWVFAKNAPKGAAMLGNIICHEIAYEELLLEKCLTEVYNDNVPSMQFQKLFNPRVLKVTDQMTYFEHIKENFYSKKDMLINACKRFV